MTETTRREIVELMIDTAVSINEIWVFGYGSLIWNPALNYVDKQIGKVYGYHRSFCLWSTIGRGSPETPGLLLGLERGGSCKGIFYRIDAKEARSELDILFRRELITASYIPTWVKSKSVNGVSFKAIAFVIDQNHHRYASSLDDTIVIETIAAARGSLGSCSEYLYETVRQLNALGMPDSKLALLAKAVLQKQQEYEHKGIKPSLDFPV